MNTQKPNFKAISNMLYEIGTLRKIPRSHRQCLLTEDVSDNLSAHMFRVTWIGWTLAQLTKADPYKVVMMCLQHDLPETRSGDQNWVNKKYVKVFEKEIIQDQIANSANSQELSKISEEYEKRESLEAKIAKDADLIDQLMLLKEHALAGNIEALEWLHLNNYEKENQQYKLLSNKIAKTLAKQILKQSPSDWWKNIWTSNRR